MALKSVSDKDFNSNLSVQGITVVDFGAPWCPPCKPLLLILEELDHELGSTVSMLKVNVDESPSCASAFSVMSMPTVIIFKDGQPVDKLVGLRPKEAYRNVINKHLS